MRTGRPLLPPLSLLTGKPALPKLLIDWGSGARAWVRRADKRDKPITELRPAFKEKEQEFSGYMNFISTVPGLRKFPKAWVTAVRATRGVYVLTIAFTGFTKYRDTGGYRLFPPLPE